MRRAVLLAALLLVGVPLAAPAAQGDDYQFQGRSPWRSGYPLNPQMYCAVVFEDPGSKFCEIRGEVITVEIVRMRIVGSGSVEVWLVDNKAPPFNQPVQRFSGICTQTCRLDIPPSPVGPWTDDDWTMFVWMSASGPATLQASVEARAQFHDRVEV